MHNTAKDLKLNTVQTMQQAQLFQVPQSFKDELKIAVIGLGYVGLPVAIALARQFKGTMGFDINKRRIADLKAHNDFTNEVDSAELSKTNLAFSAIADDLKSANFFIVTVPTPIDENRQPDLSPLKSACKLVGPYLTKGAIVVFESTVYPGVTEEYCGPLLEEYSGLKQSVDFKLGYSPERINPGDKERTVEKITKIVSGEDADTLQKVAFVYGSIIKAGIHVAGSIKVAEAAKVIENTQRDLNIALMNELSIIFDKMNIRTKDVLEAAGTKWNFLKFFPGLVGGHCIGVDPYYLTAKAETLGYHPQVILAGRKINDSMGAYVAQKMIKRLVKSGRVIKGSKVAVLGLTFKEDVPDLRNSKVPQIVDELKEFGIEPLVYDPVCNADEAYHEYRLKLCSFDQLRGLDGVILAVSHRELMALGKDKLMAMLQKGGVFVDVKSCFTPADFEPAYDYWSL